MEEAIKLACAWGTFASHSTFIYKSLPQTLASRAFTEKPVPCPLPRARRLRVPQDGFAQERRIECGHTIGRAPHAKRAHMTLDLDFPICTYDIGLRVLQSFA